MERISVPLHLMKARTMHFFGGLNKNCIVTKTGLPSDATNWIDLMLAY